MASFASKVGKNDINQSCHRNEVTEHKTGYFKIDEFATYNFRTQHFDTYQHGLFCDVVNVMQAVSEEWSSGKYIGCGNIYLYIDGFTTQLTN